MNPIYICEQGAIVRQKSKTICVEKNDEKLLQCPLIKIERVCLFGNVQLTTQAIQLFLENGIDVAFFSLNGKLRGRLVATESKNVLLRLAQYQRHTDESFQLHMVRTIVRAKLRNALILLRRYRSHHPNSEIDAEMSGLEAIMATIDQQNSVASLRGCEGIGAATYFKAFGKLFRQPYRFTQRSRRPPKDPVNALLSLGYTLITNELLGLLIAHGFDPYIGFLHGIVYGRPSLALDLVEEFRHAVIDRLTLRLFNKNIFSLTDFQQQGQAGVLLTPAALKKYFQCYEEAMRSHGEQTKSVRDTFKRQLRRLAEAIQLGKEYRPYVLKQ